MTFCYCFIQFQVYLFLLFDIFHHRYFLCYVFNKLFCCLLKAIVICDFCSVLVDVGSLRLVAVDCCYGDLYIGCYRGSRFASCKCLITCLSRSLFRGFSNYKACAASVMKFIVTVVGGRRLFDVVMGGLRLRCSRGPSAVFGKGLRIMICECFHFVITFNCLATARI